MKLNDFCCGANVTPIADDTFLLDFLIFFEEEERFLHGEEGVDDDELDNEENKLDRDDESNERLLLLSSRLVGELSKLGGTFMLFCFDVDIYSLELSKSASSSHLTISEQIKSVTMILAEK